MVVGIIYDVEVPFAVYGQSWPTVVVVCFPNCIGRRPLQGYAIQSSDPNAESLGNRIQPRNMSLASNSNDLVRFSIACSAAAAVL